MFDALSEGVVLEDVDRRKLHAYVTRATSRKKHRRPEERTGRVENAADLL